MDRPVGVASLRRGASVGEVEFGWVGVTPEHQPCARELTAALLAPCLRVAAVRSWQVAYEIDEANGAFWDLVAVLPGTAKSDWLTFVRPALLR